MMLKLYNINNIQTRQFINNVINCLTLTTIWYVYIRHNQTVKVIFKYNIYDFSEKN